MVEQGWSAAIEVAPTPWVGLWLPAGSHSMQIAHPRTVFPDPSSRRRPMGGPRYVCIFTMRLDPYNGGMLDKKKPKPKPPPKPDDDDIVGTFFGIT